MGANNNDIPVTVHGLHAITTDFQRVGMRIANFWKWNFIPTGARWVTCVIKIALCARLREANNWDVSIDPSTGPFTNIGNKLAEAGPGSLENFGYALRTGPSKFAFAGNPLAFVERSWVKAGTPR